MLDHFAPSTTLVALRLDLLEHARRKLVLGDPHTMSTAVSTRFNNAVSRARPIAFLADLLLVPLKLCCAPVVEVAQRDANLDLDVGSLTYTVSAEMTAAAKETTEQVERVVVVAAAALLALLQTLVAVLVVYLA